MNRTGIEQGQTGKVVRLVRAVAEASWNSAGLHYYDGQYGGLDEPERTAAAHSGYDRLLKLVIAIQDSGMSMPEVITAGTPTFPCSIAYKGFHGAGIHPPRFAWNNCVLRCYKSGATAR